MYGGKHLPSAGMGGKQLPPSMGGKQLPPASMGGKQLPTAAIGGKQLPPTPSESSVDPPAAPIQKYWRIRKAADDLVESRKNLAPLIGDSDDMPLSTDWNGEAWLESLDPAIVKSALDIAARCVLDAVMKKNAKDRDDDDNDEHTGVLADDIPNLPAKLAQREDLARLRQECLERAHNNKEYAKRPKKNSSVASKALPISASKADMVLSATTSATSKGMDESTSSTAPKKFTRNTPASSAAAMDARVASSRATICAAASRIFGELTPGPAIPPNESDPKVNVEEAQLISERVLFAVKNATQRADLRFDFRRRVAESSRLEDEMTDSEAEDESADDTMDIDATSNHGDDHHKSDAHILTDTWKETCAPRLKNILSQGAGHAVLLDADWESRHGRVADVLRNNVEKKFGPHLIITVEPQVQAFVKQFEKLPTKWQRVLGSQTDGSNNEEVPLSGLSYSGSSERRSLLRKKYFPDANGLHYASCHVIVTSYTNFFKDFLHFCQVPWQTAILDEGAVAWMAAAQQDTNSGLGQVWQALFSANDYQTGLAGQIGSDDYWNFASSAFSETTLKDAWIGLTARHRLVVAPSTTAPLHIPGLFDLILPQLTDAVREEWDRSRISSDEASVTHLRGLIGRVAVLHSADGEVSEDKTLLALQGKHSPKTMEDCMSSVPLPEVIQDGTFVVQNKVAFARRAALQELGNLEKSWIRYELGNADFGPILETFKVSMRFGHICLEITTASSTTSSGATGQVAGTLAFRPAVCCGRAFGSEQGLRQHIAGLHAPPDTWLCRTCGEDCVTSQARTHHERSCGQAPGSSSVEHNSAGAVPTVGQGGAKTGGKKKASRSPVPKSGGDADSDGAVRVPGYQGVWKSKTGKYFIKINNERYKEGKKLVSFDSPASAAKRHDDILCLTQDKNDPKVLLNFKEDGSRIVYEGATRPSASGLGGSSSNVVPALSVINIKDLPADVKPLLRDPRQTSRTGGNSKRHVYAYRGVCRQARKGHDRWQSQISFMGVNHYLGTFDSEWDAAAIYAWAHLILYGEEATRAAQKEGEEAAAAFEQEKKDIASGKIVVPSKPEKKKKAAKSGEGETQGKRKRATKDVGGDKRAKTATKSDKDGTSNTALAKGVGKAPVLALRDLFTDKHDSDLLTSVSQNVVSAISIGYFDSEPQASYAAVQSALRPCLQDLSATGLGCVGGALLLGLVPGSFGWNVGEFVNSSETVDDKEALAALAEEYDEEGSNAKFRSVMQGTVCILGSASKRTQNAHQSLGLGPVPLGGCVGALDCHVGGLTGSCSEQAACISAVPAGEATTFKFSCLGEDDVASLNGEVVDPNSSSLTLRIGDVVSIGARVFVFIPVIP